MQMEIPFQRKETLESVKEICEYIQTFIEQTSIDREKNLNVGVSLCGRVKPDLGYSPTFYNFGERPLADIMSEQLGINVSLDNDSRAMLYGEYMKTDMKGARNILFINVSWGLGMGIMIDGKLYKGKSGFSGEIGHNYGYDNQIICHCGKRGCLETEISCSALFRKFIERLKAGEMSVDLGLVSGGPGRGSGSGTGGSWSGTGRCNSPDRPSSAAAERAGAPEAVSRPHRTCGSRTGNGGRCPDREA